MHIMGFAPGHQRLAAGAGVGPQNDLHVRPSTADLACDALHFFQRACAGILVGRALARGQEMVAAEDVQRQIRLGRSFM